MVAKGFIQQTRGNIKEKLATTPPGTWAKAGVGVLVGGVVLGWFAFPYILDKVVAMQINLAQGKDSRSLWIQLPAVDCNVYIFNITNPTQVMQGDKPAVQEVGPYCYKLLKDKLNIVEDSTTDTISYSARSKLLENQKGSGCPAPELTGDEMLVVPNIPMMAILLSAEKDFPPAMLTLVNQALPAIFGRISDVFLRVSARQLLFGGVPINCTARALIPRAVCIALKQNSRGLKQLGEGQYSFSFFGARNNTPEEFRYTVKRGTDNVLDIGRVVAVDGKSELPFWRGECNKFQGTDGTVFPPFRVRENGSLSAYASEICKSLIGTYEGDVVYKGVTGYGYSTMLADSENNPGERCYCPTDKPCRKTGVIDVLKCQGAPLVVSHPHFYLGSADYVNGVTGLKPSKDKHGIFLALEPISGSPLMLRKRLQFNIDLKPIPYVPVTQRLRRTLMPLIWAEELFDLDGDMVGMLEASLFRPMRAVDVIKWLAVVTGVGLGVAAAVIKYRNTRRDKVHKLKEGFGYEEGTNTAVKPYEIGKDNRNYVNEQLSNEESVNYGLSAVTSLKDFSPKKANYRKHSTYVKDEYYKPNTQITGLDLNSVKKGELADYVISSQMLNLSPSYVTVNGNKRDNESQINNSQRESIMPNLYETSDFKSNQSEQVLLNNKSLNFSLTPLELRNSDTLVNIQEEDQHDKYKLKLSPPLDKSIEDIMESHITNNGFVTNNLENEHTSSKPIEGRDNNFLNEPFDFNYDFVETRSETRRSSENNYNTYTTPQFPTEEELQIVQEDIVKLKEEMAIIFQKNID